jgi:hypothetical protein
VSWKHWCLITWSYEKPLHFLSTLKFTGWQGLSLLKYTCVTTPKPFHATWETRRLENTTHFGLCLITENTTESDFYKIRNKMSPFIKRGKFFYYLSEYCLRKNSNPWSLLGYHLYHEDRGSKFCRMICDSVPNCTVSYPTIYNHDWWLIDCSNTTFPETVLLHRTNVGLGLFELLKNEFCLSNI